MDIIKEAVLSEDRLYRFTLTRTWDLLKGTVLFIGVNPSTADETEDDPTIRRCINFANSWGYGGIVMVNLFALRATDPKELQNNINPIGPFNDLWLRDSAYKAREIVCAWGVNGIYKNRDKAVIKLLSAYELKCLGTTKDGHPKHPLYIRANTQLENFK